MRSGDLAALTVASEDPLIRKYAMPGAKPAVDEAREWVRLQLRPWSEDVACFAIAHDVTDELLGSISLHRVDEHHAEIGFWITPSARRRGNASAAVELVNDWAFRDLGVRHVSMLTDLDNEGSIGVARRTGFRSEDGPVDFEVVPTVIRAVLVWSRSLGG
jgi:RimJ/RimL family protein N-acetyltransferase